MANAITAFQTLLKRGDGGGPETFTTIAEVTNIQGPKLKTDVKDVTSHSSPNATHEKLPTLKDGGQVQFDLNFIIQNSTQSYTSGILLDWYNRTKRNFQLVFPDAGVTTWAFSAFVIAFESKAPVDDKLSATCTLELTGTPTLA